MKTKQDFPSINERPPEGIKDDGTKVRVLVVDDSIFCCGNNFISFTC